MNPLKCGRCPESTHSVHSGSTEGVGVEQQNKAEQGGHRGGGGSCDNS